MNRDVLYEFDNAQVLLINDLYDKLHELHPEFSIILIEFKSEFREICTI